MRLRSGGIDVFYIDESHDNKHYLVTSLRIPLLRSIEGVWTLTWPSQFEATKNWRKFLKNELTIPTTKELHGNKLATGRGNFKLGKHNFDKPKAGSVYRQCLASLDFLQDSSVMSVVAARGISLFGRDRLNAALLALFQRIRRQCQSEDRNGLIFFDQGHPEYRKLYRASCRYLVTGRRFGPPQNLPLDMFVKDGNEKDSKHCFFTQIADLIAYAAFLKIKGEAGTLTDKQKQYAHDNIYESLPAASINQSASHHRDGIVRLQ